MVKFIIGQRYRVELPRYKFPKPLTYMGLAEGDYRCMVCGREGGTREGWSNRHSFVEGDPDNPTDQSIIGTECIKKCKIEKEQKEDHMSTMREVFESIDEAMFRGMGGGKSSSDARAKMDKERTMGDVFEAANNAVRGLSESVSRYCEIWKASNGMWYMDLAGKENGERDDATTYGRFRSEGDAEKFMHDLFSNPGMVDMDDQGKRKPPTRSPNGDPVVDPIAYRRSQGICRW